MLRHAQARSRKSWRKDDRLRPLLADGKRQAARLVPLLGAYGLTRLVTSSSLRCVQTLAPYAEASGWPLQRDRRAERGGRHRRRRCSRSSTSCSHGKECAAAAARTDRCCPTVLDALGVETDKLARRASWSSSHHRKGKIAAFERY